MIPIAVEQMEAIELGARYAQTLAAVERAYALGDLAEVEVILGGIDPIELRMTAETLGALHKLWSTILEIRGGTTGRGLSHDGSPRRQAEPLSPAPSAAPTGPTAPDNLHHLDQWSRKAPCG